MSVRDSLLKWVRIVLLAAWLARHGRAVLVAVFVAMADVSISNVVGYAIANASSIDGLLLLNLYLLLALRCELYL